MEMEGNWHEEWRAPTAYHRLMAWSRSSFFRFPQVPQVIMAVQKSLASVWRTRPAWPGWLRS